MHHALEVQEILLNIFAQCRPSLPSWRTVTPDLLALACTCRAFKEPALDVLWEELDNIDPIVRCLPEASHALLAERDVEGPHGPTPGNKYYLFSRTPTQAEWHTLRGYARRVRSIVQDFGSALDEESIRILSDLPSTGTIEPLFPNLRHLRCEYSTEAIPLLHLPFPSLISMDLVFGDPSIFQIYHDSFPRLSESIRRLSLRVRQLEDTLLKMDSVHISRWQNLQSVVFPQIDLDVAALTHLSSMHALTRLAFKLTMTLSAPESPLYFSGLHDFTLHSGSLDPVSRLLSWIQLPTLADFTVIIASRPSKNELSSFFTGVRTSGAGRTIKGLMLDQSAPSIRDPRDFDTLSLDLEDLRPCTALSRLCRIKLNIEWNVHLTDRALLELTSAWPDLEHLVINPYSGWNTRAGITPDALMQLLQTHPSLRWVALALDTRGYATPPPGGFKPSLELKLPPAFSFNVLDSVIEAGIVPVVADFFAAIVPCSTFAFSAWCGAKMVKPEGWKAYKDRWDNVFRLANRRSAFLSHHLARIAHRAPMKKNNVADVNLDGGSCFS